MPPRSPPPHVLRASLCCARWRSDGRIEIVFSRMLRRPYSLTGAGYAAVPQSALPQSRGERSAGKRGSLAIGFLGDRRDRPRRLRRRLLSPCDRREAPPGAPLAAFLSSGPFFRAGTERPES